LSLSWSTGPVDRQICHPKTIKCTMCERAGVEAFVPVPTPQIAGHNRYAPLPSDPPEVAARRERMNTNDAKTIYKERATTTECANAYVLNQGLTRFRACGLEAVKATA
jgi:hypothetical protein